MVSQDSNADSQTVAAALINTMVSFFLQEKAA